MKKILIIDDEEKLRKLLARIISLEGFSVLECGDAKSALKKLEQTEVDVILCDVKLPDANGVELSLQIKKNYPLTEIIVLTAYGNIPDGVQAIKNGAFDYITKGDDNNKIIPLLHRAIEKVNLQKRLQHLEERVGEKYSFDTIIGDSKKIMEAVSLAKKVAATDATVLLLGETGTGKEVFSQAIHIAGARSSKPFIAINCSAFGKELLESELFGHKAGAFTGAVKDKKGLFEEANGGTIFLDEIGEMNLDLQAKLLRVLEAKEFIKVGDTKTIKTDVRIIAATNRDLQKESEEGRFRLDLYYRLSVFQIVLPPLRERIKDIEELANHFAKVFSLKINKRDVVLSKEYLAKLKLHSWKGNIRELKNIIERSVILSDADVLTCDSLPYEMQHITAAPGGMLSAFSMASVEKLHIQKVLNHTKGNKAETARLLEIGIATLYRKLEEYQIQ
ncbi:MAG: sigma-54-dependent Fis family transcriptional regulator [Bacteroidetes bacterium]|nr:sigma-54-dependent Fis family transcriptional regulator [Bacteroidota bacterium]